MMAGVGALRHLELSKRDHAGPLKPVHDGRVEGRHELRMNLCAAGARSKCRVAEILQSDRNAMKRSAPDAFGEFAVVLSGLRHCPFCKHNRVAVKAAVKFPNSAQRRFGDLRR